MTWRRLIQASVPRAVGLRFPVLEPLGMVITPNHFHEPVPVVRRLWPGLWDRPSECVAVDWIVPDQITLLDAFVSSCRTDIDSLAMASGDSSPFSSAMSPSPVSMRRSFAAWCGMLLRSVSLRSGVVIPRT